jgi:hypothetical protein
MTRRQLLLSAGCLAGWAGAGCRNTGSRAPSAGRTAPASEPFTPSLAVSLFGVATKLRKRAGAGLAELGGLNRIIGVSIEEGGDASWPSLHVDDLAIALRSAYRTGPEYQEAPGCSIDPREGAEDPWQMQKVRVFGMPFSCPMALRHVSVDYELKKASLGLTVLKAGLPSLFETGSDPISICADASKGNSESQQTFRFWFCPLVQDSPRFAQDGSAMWIEKPVGVQVLTEQEFLDQRAHRTGSKPAEGAALRFARAVSGLLAEGTLPQYAALRGDFRLLEAAKVMALMAHPVIGLAYFLSEHTLRAEKVPQYVGGLRREESGEVTCDNPVTERAEPGGMSYQAQESTRRYHRQVRGGVEASVSIAARDVRATSGELADVLDRVRKAKPSDDAAVWTVAA